MNMKEYHTIRRKKYAAMHKSRVDASYEYYCALSDEDKQISKNAFACQLAKHFGLSISSARNVTNNLIAEYKVEFVKYKMSSHSRGFTGKTHSDEAKAKIAAASIKCNAARAITCKEQGINYRNYKQDADKQIEVVDFNNTRVKSISEKIIV